VKLRTPEPTAQALATLRLPAPQLAARALGLIEVAAGVVAVVRPAYGAPVLAILYASFAAFVAHALATDAPLSSCGCLGETDTEPSRAHVAVTGIAALAAGLAALQPPASLSELVVADPLEGALLVVSIGTAVYLAYLTLVFLPDALSAYRKPVREGDG